MLLGVITVRGGGGTHGTVSITEWTYLDFHIFRASKDSVLPYGHGENSLFMSLKGLDGQQVLQIPHL